MSKLTIFVSATIVLIFCVCSTWAAPLDQVPADQVQPDPWPNGPPPENMQISEPPQIAADEVPPPDAHYYAYRQQFTFRVGANVDASDLKNSNDLVVGFQYLFPKFLSPKLEAGADLHNDGIGHVHAGTRWIYNERGYFRPSVKAGLDVMLKGKEGLATFTHFENLFIRTTGTLEYVVWNPYSVRVEAEALIGSKKIYLEGTLALSRGW